MRVSVGVSIWCWYMPCILYWESFCIFNTYNDYKSIIYIILDQVVGLSLQQQYSDMLSLKTSGLLTDFNTLRINKSHVTIIIYLHHHFSQYYVVATFRGDRPATYVPLRCLHEKKHVPPTVYNNNVTTLRHLVVLADVRRLAIYDSKARNNNER